MRVSQVVLSSLTVLMIVACSENATVEAPLRGEARGCGRVAQEQDIRRSSRRRGASRRRAACGEAMLNAPSPAVAPAMAI